MFFIPLQRLEYVLKPYENDLVSLSLEETIDTQKTNYSLLRYFYFFDRHGNRFLKHKFLHMIVNKNTAEIKHLDLSYFYYMNEKIEQRSIQHIKDKVVSADHKKKIVRIDAKNPNGYFAEFELFADIAGSLMEGNKNPEISKFLAGI